MTAMKKSIIVLCFLGSAPAIAGNFATCILEKMPGTQNDAAASAIANVCKEKYPLMYNDVPQGSGRGWLSYDSGSECAANIAAKTTSQRAGQLIYGACNRLYNPPVDFSFNEEVILPPKKTDFSDLIPAKEPAKPAATELPAQPKEPINAAQRKTPKYKGPTGSVSAYSFDAYYPKTAEQGCAPKPVMTDAEIDRCRKK